MTAADLASHVGKRGVCSISLGERGRHRLLVRVKILDARRVYGRTDLLVTPEAGSGVAWVVSSRVEVGTGSE